MLFTVFQKDFYEGIQIVQKAVSTKTTLPILNGIYLEADKEKGLKLIANNLEVGIEHWVKADIKKEGKIVIKAAQLIGIIRELPSAEIKIEVNMENNNVNISCLNSEFNLKSLNAEEFPQLPEVDDAIKYNISLEKIKDLIQKTKFAVSSDETQPAMTGGLMIINSKEISIVTTNTYRLAYKYYQHELNINEENTFILPAITLNELDRLIDEGEDKEAEVLINKNYLCFTFNEIVLISRLIEGKFPNFKQVLPSEFETEIKIDRQELLDAVKRVSLIARLDSNIITLKVQKEKLDILSKESEEGNAFESVEIESNGENQSIDIDASYLIDVLKVLSDDVINIRFTGSLKPLTVRRIEKDDYIYLIMPIRP